VLPWKKTLNPPLWWAPTQPRVPAHKTDAHSSREFSNFAIKAFIDANKEMPCDISKTFTKQGISIFMTIEFADVNGRSRDILKSFFA
jgi:hypothetical protein